MRRLHGHRGGGCGRSASGELTTVRCLEVLGSPRGGSEKDVSDWTESRFEQLRREIVVPDFGTVFTAMAAGTTFGSIVGDLSSEDQQAVRAAFAACCAPFTDSDGVHLPMSQWIVRARR
jgi:hypothetical protein